MATLAMGRRIDVAVVDDEIARLRAQRRAFDTPGASPGAAGVRRAGRGARGGGLTASTGVQLDDVLGARRESASLLGWRAGRGAEVAGARKASVNDADLAAEIPRALRAELGRDVAKE